MTLRSGVQMPMEGFGVYQMPDRGQCRADSRMPGTCASRKRPVKCRNRQHPPDELIYAFGVLPSISCSPDSIFSFPKSTRSILHSIFHRTNTDFRFLFGPDSGQKAAYRVFSRHTACTRHPMILLVLTPGPHPGSSSGKSPVQRRGPRCWSGSRGTSPGSVPPPPRRAWPPPQSSEDTASPALPAPQTKR